MINLDVKLVSAFILRGKVNDIEFIYNFACDVFPRFVDYIATEQERNYLKKLLDNYLSTDEMRLEIAVTMKGER